jgi:hypothetical protein
MMDWLKADQMPQGRREPPAPQHLETIFRLIGQSGRPICCATYQVATGVELRIFYEDDEDTPIRTQLFKPGRDASIADLATT